VGAVTVEAPESEQYTITLLLAILIIIAINLGWFLYSRKRKG